MAFSTQVRSSLPNAERWREQPELCSKCGKCRAVCPVFRETRAEASVARGRLALIGAMERGEMPADSNTFAQALSMCLSCYRCVHECPSGIEVVAAVHGARARWSSNRIVGRMVRLMLRHIVPHRRRYDTVMRVASLAQKVFPRAERAPLRHLPLLLADSRRVPDLARQTFLSSVRGRQFLVPGADRQVVFFVGCLINYVYPHVGHALVRVLNRCGVGVLIPQEQVCCGTPALTAGHERSARKLRAKNVQALLSAGADDIVSACASCTNALKRDFVPHLDGRDRDRVHVYDATEYLARVIPTGAARLDLTATYHDPCHLRWGQDVSEQPRELLCSVCNYAEMACAEECCGFGGTFSLLHYELSQRIAARKAESIAATNADVVATACPGCMMQLEMLAAERGLDRDVRHVVELLDEAQRSLNSSATVEQRSAE